MAQHFQPASSYFGCHLCFALATYCLTSNYIYDQTHRRTERENGLRRGYSGKTFSFLGVKLSFRKYTTALPRSAGGREVMMQPLYPPSGWLCSKICQPEHTNMQNCFKSYCFLSTPKQALSSLCFVKVVTGHWPRTVIWYCCLKSNSVNDSLQGLHGLCLLPSSTSICKYAHASQEPIRSILMKFWGYERYTQGVS